MEKLILRSVMYGADKIPDSWFEKVPGGFYKTKDGKTVQVTSKDGSRPSMSGSGTSGQHRRRSTGERSRGPATHGDYYDGDGSHRSSRRRGGGGRDSYDGGVDDDFYSGDDWRRRRNHSSTRRRKSFDEDDDWHGFDDGSSRDPRWDPRYDAHSEDQRQPQASNQGSAYPNQYGQAAARDTAGPAVAGAASRGNAPYPYTQPNSPNPASPPSTTSSNRQNLANGYVPYANIYGQPQGQQQRQGQQFSQRPESNVGSAQANPYDQMAHPIAPQQYHQDPYAQDAAATAAMAGAAGAAAGAAWQDQNRYYNDPRYDSRYDERYQEPAYDSRHDDRYRYDEAGRPYDSQLSSRHRSTRRHRSPSYDSREDRKPRSERRDEDVRRTKSQGGARGKSMQRIKEQIDKNFDRSQKGLGYGLVGALAGGLAGNEFGKGPIPTAIGAALGGGIANAYEARERYVPSGYRPSAYQFQQMTVDPRRPLNAQLGREPDRAASNEPRRKSQVVVRRDPRLIGYYSD